MTGIDRKRVGRSFHRQAGEYDRHAVVQKRVVERLAALLAGEEAPRRVLDVGTGTGALLERIAGMYPDAAVTGLDLAPAMAQAARERLAGRERLLVCAGDAEHLPFAPDAFDLVVSSSTFQWLESLRHAFDEAYRVLAPGGSFRFALFGGETLRELKASYRQALAACGGGVDRTHRFVSVEEVRTALEGSGFAACVAHGELETEYHADARAMLRSIRAIGAGNASAVPSSGLAGRRVTQEMLAVYDREYLADGRLPATYEVIYGWGLKPSEGVQRPGVLPE
jgi:malonyl-CoA O-methyltransferase